MFIFFSVGGVITLQKQKEERQYGDAANLLQGEFIIILVSLQDLNNISCYFLGLQEVISHFQNYSEIPQIKDLALQVKGLQNEFGEQILSDFHKAFAAENAKHFSPNRQLAEACLVVSVLDPKVKRTLLKFILSRQLAEYSIGKVAIEMYT